MPQTWTNLSLDWKETIQQIKILGDVAPLEFNHRVLVATFLGPNCLLKKQSRIFLMQTCWFIIYPEGPLLLLPNFRIGMVKWCAMHLIHLGCDLWIVGNCLKTLLLDTTLWGDPADGCSDDDRLLTAWQEFKLWARRHKWQLFGCLRYWSTCFSYLFSIWTRNSLNESALLLC